MPKRFIDGEALWLSDKVKALPPEYRLHYANWVPMAEANGVFEASASRIQARIYSYLLPKYTIQMVRRVLEALVRVGLVKTWDEGGKTWGYFIGIAKAGRLPELRHLDRYKNLPPSPPFDDDGIIMGVIPGTDGTDVG